MWSDENSEAFVEMPLHKLKITICCALWAVIGPYFFKDDDGEHYIQMAELYFLCDKRHITLSIINLLRDTFNEGITSCDGHVNWPPRSLYHIYI